MTSNSWPPKKTLRERLNEIEAALKSIKSSLSTISILVWIILLETCTSTASRSVKSDDLKTIESRRLEDSKRLDDRLDKIEASLESLSMQNSSKITEDAHKVWLDAIAKQNQASGDKGAK